MAAADSRAAARLAYEMNRLESRGLKERSDIARSCSRWRIPRISLCVAVESGLAVEPVLERNCNELIRAK